MNGNLYVAKRALFSGDVSINANARLGSGSSSVSINKDISGVFALDVSGATKIRGAMDIAGSFTVNGQAVNGTGTISTLTVTLDSSLNGKLSVGQDLSVNGNLYVAKRALFSGDVSINANAQLGSGSSSVAINKDISPGNALDVSGLTVLRNTLYVFSDVSFNNKLSVGGDVSFNNKLSVGGDVSFNNKLSVGGDASFNNKLSVSGYASFNDKLSVGGDVSFNQNLSVGQDLSLNGNLYVSKRALFLGDVSLNKNVKMGSGSSSVAINKDISGEFALDVNGITKFRGAMDVVGNFTINGVAPVSSGSALTGNIQVGTNSGFVTVDKPYFYLDPLLTIYYDFDTSINGGTQIKNIASASSTYDGVLNIPGTSGSTTGMIDTTVFYNGKQNNTSIASFKNDPALANYGIRIGQAGTSVPVSSIMSFSFWVYKKSRTVTTDFDRVFHFTDSTSIAQAQNENNTIALDISSGGNIFPVITKGGGTTPISLITPSLPIVSYDLGASTWNHVVWTINGTKSSIYINGSLTQNDTLSENITLNTSTTRNSGAITYTYTSATSATRDFSGNIDDFRYYNGKALNYAEIYQLYNNSFYTFDICGGFLANGSSVIYETVGSVASPNSGTLTLLHGDAGGASSIMFKSVNSTNDYAYVQYQDNSTIPYIQSFYKWNLSPGATNTYGPSTNVDRSVGSNGTVMLSTAGSTTVYSVLAPSPPSTFPSNTYCISFNQTNQLGGQSGNVDYIQATVIPMLQNITISFWIRPNIIWDTSNPGGGFYYSYFLAHFSNAGTRAIEFHIRGYDQRLIVLINNDGVNYKISNSSIINNVWTHVAFTYSANNGYIYINGIRDETTIGTGYTALGQLNTYDSVLFGMKWGQNGGTGYEKGFRGYMNFINIFNQTLSDSNITYLYNNPSYGQTTEGGLMTIGIENDSPYNDRITLWPNSGTGYVGINTKTPQATLDINGTLNINGNITNNSGAVGITGESGTLLTLKNTSTVGARSEVNIDFLTQAGNYGMGRISVFDATVNTNGSIGGYTSIMKFYLAGVNAVTEYMSLTSLGLNVAGITVGKGAGNMATNTVVGYQALATSGPAESVAVGYEALNKANTITGHNDAFGYRALYNCVGGTNNTAIGYTALKFVTSSFHNTAIGRHAGNGDSGTPYAKEGNNNTFLGSYTGMDGNYNNSTAVGSSAIITASNQIKLGTNTESTFVGSALRLTPTSTHCDIKNLNTGYNLNFGIGTTDYLTVNSSGITVTGVTTSTSFNANSDYRVKENVVPLDDSFTIDGLNPVRYNFKSSGKQDIGFIAHEVQEFYPFLVSGEKDGKDTQSLNYNGFIGILTKEIQLLKKKVAEQEARIADQEAKALEQSAKALEQSAKALEQSAKALEQETRIQALEKMMINK